MIAAASAWDFLTHRGGSATARRGDRFALGESLAQAATSLDPSQINFSTAGGKAQFAKWFYFFVNGPTADYTISGPSGGLIGVINGFTNVIGSALEAAGSATDCTNLPQSGSQTVSGENGSFVVTFSAGDRAIPATYSTTPVKPTRRSWRSLWRGPLSLRFNSLVTRLQDSQAIF
jgi:hypothetical protein